MVDVLLMVLSSKGVGEPIYYPAYCSGGASRRRLVSVIVKFGRWLGIQQGGGLTGERTPLPIKVGLGPYHLNKRMSRQIP
jgi:hypothetical protein